MVSSTRSGRHHPEEGSKDKQYVSKAKDVSGRQSISSVGTTNIKSNASTSKECEERGRDLCYSPTFRKRNTVDINTRKSSRLEKRFPLISRKKKISEQQDTSHPSPLRRSGRIENISSSSTSSQTPNNFKKKKIRKDLDQVTQVGKRDKEKNVEHNDLTAKRRKRLDAVTYMASFTPLKKKRKSPGTSFEDAAASTIIKNNITVESHVDHQEQRNDKLHELKVSSSSTKDQNFSKISSSEILLIDEDSLQKVEILQDCQDPEIMTRDENCLPDVIFAPWITEKGFTTDQTKQVTVVPSPREHLQQEVVALSECQVTQITNTTGDCLPDIIYAPWITKEDYNAEETSVERRENNVVVLGEDIGFEGLSETDKLPINLQTKVSHCTRNIQKPSEMTLFCEKCEINCHVSSIDPPPEKAPSGTWQCNSCAGLKTVSDTDVAVIKKNIDKGEENLDTVNNLTDSSLQASDLPASECQFRKCLNEPSQDSSDSKFLEFWVPVQLSNLQLEYYCFSLISNLAILRTCSKNNLGASDDVVVSSRKCCDHPYLVDSSLLLTLRKDVQPVEYLDIDVRASGKLTLLDKLLENMKKQGLRVIILYHQFVSGDGNKSMSTGDILDDFISQRFGADSYERIDSRVSAPKKQNAMQLFNKKDSERFIFLIENRACLPSIKLSAVDAVIIFGSDWNPLIDLRALHKINVDSRARPLKVFRFYSFHTLEEKLLLLAKLGVFLENNITNISRKAHSLLGYGAHYLFNELYKFHKDFDLSECSKTSLRQNSILDNTVSEILSQFSNISGCISNSFSVITKAHHNCAVYSRSISLYGENDISIENEEPPQFFWPKLLDGKHPQWIFITEQPQKPRRKVQLFEEQTERLRDENDNAKRKRRKITLSIMNSVSWQPSTHDKMTEVSTASMNGSNNNTHGVQTDHTNVPEEASIDYGCGKLRTSQKNLHRLLAPQILNICDVLQLPNDVKTVAELFLDHIMNNHQVVREPESILQAFKLSLCWRAASFLKYRVDHKESLLRVKNELRYECSESEARSVYSRLHILKKRFSLPVNDLMKCIESDNLASPSNILLQDKSTKNIPVTSGLLEVNNQTEDGEIRELSEHFSEQKNQIGRLVVDPVSFHDDKSVTNANSLTVHTEKNDSNQVSGCVQKPNYLPNNVESFFHSQEQEETSSLEHVDSGNDYSAASCQMDAGKEAECEITDGRGRSKGENLCPLQSEPQLPALQRNFSEMEGPATSMTDVMATEGVQKQISGIIPVSHPIADSKGCDKSKECIAERDVQCILPSSHMSVAPERMVICNGMHSESLLMSPLPNMETFFLSNVDVNSIELETFRESDGSSGGQLCHPSQTKMASILQTTEAVFATEHEMVVTSNAGTQNLPLKSHLNVVHRPNVSSSENQVVAVEDEVPQEPTSSRPILNFSLQQGSNEQLQLMLPTGHIHAPTQTTLESVQACLSEIQTTTSSTEILMPEKSSTILQQDASPNQPFLYSLENRLLNQIDLQAQRTNNHGDMENSPTNSLVINSRLSPRELKQDPLENEILRIRKEIDAEIQEFDNKKLQIKQEYECELDKLERKYEALLEDVDKTHLKKKKMLEIICSKVSLNQILAREFRSKFAENKASAAKPSNFQGRYLSSTSQLHCSQSQTARVLPTSTATTPMAATNVAVTNVALTSRDSSIPVSISCQTQSTPSVQVVHNSSELFSSCLGRSSTNSMLSPLGNVHTGNRMIRSPAPHLAFRPIPSISSPIVSSEACRRPINSHPPCCNALPTIPNLQQVPVGNKFLSSLDVGKGADVSAEVHSIPIESALQVADVGRNMPSAKSSCGTNQIPSNHVPTVSMLSKIPLVAQSLPLSGSEQNPRSFSGPIITSSPQVTTTTQSFPSMDSSIMDDHLPENTVSVTPPIQLSTISVSMASVDDSNLELLRSSHPLSLPQGTGNANTVTRVDKIECVDLPAHGAELGNPFVMNTIDPISEPHIVCVSSDED